MLRTLIHRIHTKTQDVIMKIPDYLLPNPNLTSDTNLTSNLITSMVVHRNFLTDVEESTLLSEIEPYMSKLRYEFDHWDDAIHGYRETERLKWLPKNEEILQKVRLKAFPTDVAPLKFVHILDLNEKGWIKPHVDAVRFCGDTIAGLCLLSDAVMRLVHEKQKDIWMDVLLERRSLYIMNGIARYDFTHEILKNEDSYFGDKLIKRTRRISVICRNEPTK